MMSRVTLNPEMFRAYDIRGIVGKDLDAPVAESVGKAIGTYLLNQQNGDKVVVGMDNRPSSEELKAALVNALRSTGCNVTDIGLCTSPMLYKAVFDGDFCGGTIVSASHNPKEYNGFKIVGRQAYPVAAEEMYRLRDLAMSGQFATGKGSYSRLDTELVYDDTDGTRKMLRPNDVFVRRGSITDLATIDELIQIAQRNQPHYPEILVKLDDLEETTEDAIDRANRIAEVNRPFSSRDASPADTFRDEISREPMEMVFVGLLSAVVISSLWMPNTTWIHLAALPVVFISIVVTTILHLTHFGIRRTLFTGALLGIVLTVWFQYGFALGHVEEVMLSAPLLGILANGLVGMLTGLAIGILLAFWRPLDM